MINPAKVFLSRYTRLRSKCRSLERSIQSLREQAESITIAMDPDKVQSSSRIHDPIAEAAAAIADTERLLVEAIAEAAQTMNEITRTIMKVQGDHLQELLLLHYIDGLTWEDVALAMNYDVRQIYRLHGIALQTVIPLMKDVSVCQYESVDNVTSSLGHEAASSSAGSA